MDVAGLLDGVLGHAAALARSLGTHSAAALAVALLAALGVAAIYRWRRRRVRRTRQAHLQGGIRDLKDELRRRLADPAGPFAGAAAAGPTVGAGEAFEADLEAAATTVLVEAGGDRANAKHLLRKRLRENGIGNGKLNGSEAAYWRQLGALSLLDNTRDALTAYSRAADLAPGDPQAQMLLGVLALRAGRLEAAEAAFRRQMELANGEAAARYRAGVMLGDVLVAKGEPDAALPAYEAAEREVLTLAEEQPDNAGWQRDVSIAHDRLGDLLLARGQVDLALERFQRSLAIAEALARRDVGNAGWQRDVSVSHDRIGDALERKDDLDGALESYRSGLALAEALARREPKRLEWQWDLSESLDRIGDVLLAKHKTGEALAAYRRGLGIAESLAGFEAARTSWQRDLAVSYHKVGSLEAARGNESEARALLERGRTIIAHLARIAAYQAQWRSDLAKFDSALETLGP